MTIFEHIMITSSIILGLAIAQLLTGFADSLRMKRVSLYWPHTLFVISQLLACLNWGFGVWIYKQQVAWTGFELLFFILTPILTFLIARFMYPFPMVKVSLQKHYYDMRRYIFGIAAFVIVELNISVTMMLDRQLLSVANLFGGLLVLIMIVLAFTGREIVHKILMPAVLLIMVLFSIYFRIGSS